MFRGRRPASRGFSPGPAGEARPAKLQECSLSSFCSGEQYGKIVRENEEIVLKKG